MGAAPETVTVTVLLLAVAQAPLDTTALKYVVVVRDAVV
jgi:hypothetical protein